MRIGFSVKELAEILGIDARRAGQSVDPAVDKIARLWMRNPTKTMELLLDRVTTFQRARTQALRNEMSPAELEDRKCMAHCRFDSNGKTCREFKADVATGRAPHPNEQRI